MRDVSETNQTEELTRFAILIIVLIGVVVIVALARPLLFEHIVPVVLGDGIEAGPPSAELAPIGPESPELQEPAADAYPITSEEESVDLPAEEAYPSLLEETAETPPDDAYPVEVETAVQIEAEPPEPQSISHIVRTGETLTSISKQYGVTVSDIQSLNDFTNPNRILVGDTIIVPLP